MKISCLLTRRIGTDARNANNRITHASKSQNTTGKITASNTKISATKLSFIFARYVIRPRVWKIRWKGLRKAWDVPLKKEVDFQGIIFGNSYLSTANRAVGERSTLTLVCHTRLLKFI